MFGQVSGVAKFPPQLNALHPGMCMISAWLRRSVMTQWWYGTVIQGGNLQYIFRDCPSESFSLLWCCTQALQLVIYGANTQRLYQVFAFDGWLCKISHWEWASCWRLSHAGLMAHSEKSMSPQDSSSPPEVCNLLGRAWSNTGEPRNT